MLTTCPNCGRPLCPECGSHVNPGFTGAPVLQKAAQSASMAVPVQGALVTWDSVKPGTNETWAHYYGVLAWVNAVRILTSYGNGVAAAGTLAMAIDQLRSEWPTPAGMLGYVSSTVGAPTSSIPVSVIGDVLGRYLVSHMPAGSIRLPGLEGFHVS